MKGAVHARIEGEVQHSPRGQRDQIKRIQMKPRAAA